MRVGFLLLSALALACAGDAHAHPQKSAATLDPQKQPTAAKAAKQVEHAKVEHKSSASQKERELKQKHAPVVQPAAAAPVASYTLLERLHILLAGAELLVMFYYLLAPTGGAGDEGATSSSKYYRCLTVLLLIFVVEAIASAAVPMAHVTASVGIFLAVLFTINPVEEAGRLFNLNMGWVPVLCVAWLAAIGLLSREDIYRSLYGTDALRPYHLVVMFTGSVYLCTSLERSGFLHSVRPRRHAAMLDRVARRTRRTSQPACRWLCSHTRAHVSGPPTARGCGCRSPGCAQVCRQVRPLAVGALLGARLLLGRDDGRDPRRHRDDDDDAGDDPDVPPAQLARDPIPLLAVLRGAPSPSSAFTLAARMRRRCISVP